MKPPAPRAERTRSGLPRSASRGAPTGRSSWPSTTPSGPLLYEREAARVRVHPGRPGPHARARRFDLGAGAVGQAGHRHAPRRPGLGRRTRLRPAAGSRAATSCASASPTGSSTGCSRGRTRTSTCTPSATARPEIDRMLGLPRPPAHPRRRARSATRRRSASWPLASGPTSSTTPTPRARSSKASSRAPLPIATTPALVDSERGNRYRPGTHMNTYFYFRCPA